MQTNKARVLEVLRKLNEMGVTLNGCGCCGANKLTITDPSGNRLTYEVEGGFDEKDGSYNYGFYSDRNEEFRIVSNGNDENALR